MISLAYIPYCAFHPALEYSMSSDMHAQQAEIINTFHLGKESSIRRKISDFHETHPGARPRSGRRLKSFSPERILAGLLHL